MKINPRLRELSERLQNEELAQRDRAIVEEREKRRLEEIALAELSKKKNQEYLGNLEELKAAELDTAFYALVNHPDFPVLYNQLKTLDTIHDKWGHLVRKGYEISQQNNALPPFGFIMQHHETYFKRRLEEYGLYLLYPFFKEDETSSTKQSCIIDSSEDPVMCSCDGKHEMCKVFEDTAKNAATGLVQLTFPTRQEPKYKIPNIEVEPVDKEDLENWWLQEGRYD